MFPPDATPAEVIDASVAELLAIAEHLGGVPASRRSLDRVHPTALLDIVRSAYAIASAWTAAKAHRAADR